MAKRISSMATKTPLEKAEAQIKLCAVLAYLSAAVTIIFSILAITGTSSLFIITPEAPLITIARGVLIGVLGFGVSKKSRICAILLLAIFCRDMFMQLASGADMNSMALSILIWGYAYVCGVLGTFAYKRLKAEEALWLEDEDANPYGSDKQAEEK